MNHRHNQMGSWLLRVLGWSKPGILFYCRWNTSTVNSMYCHADSTVQFCNIIDSKVKVILETAAESKSSELDNWQNSIGHPQIAAIKILDWANDTDYTVIKRSQLFSCIPLIWYMKTLVHAFVSSRLDYCNSLLYGVIDELLQKWQVIQNAVTGARQFDHITLVLHELHWLPVR